MMRGHGKKIISAVLALALVAGRIGGLLNARESRQSLAPTRLPGRQLILDAGHGGEDGGAVSVTGVPESGVNLEIVRKLDALFGFCGVAPILLRSEDVSLHDPNADTLRKKKVSDLHNRVAAIEAVENALVISIHQNTFPDPAYHGAQVFYREEEESMALAAAIQTSLRKGIDPENGREPSKIADTVYLMKHITCPAVLIECGFLSNAQEEAKLRQGGYQTQIGLCIASAVLQYEKNSGGTAGEDVV